MTDRENVIFRNATLIAETRERQGRRLQSQEAGRLVCTAFRAIRDALSYIRMTPVAGRED